MNSIGKVEARSQLRFEEGVLWLGTRRARLGHVAESLCQRAGGDDDTAKKSSQGWRCQETDGKKIDRKENQGQKGHEENCGPQIFETYRRVRT